MMNKTTLIFGVGVIAGVTAVAILTAVNQKQNGEPIQKDSTPDTPPVPPKVSVPVENKESFNSAVYSMSERHQEAAKIVRDAVSIICENGSTSSETDSKLEDISAELDNLLGEV